MAFGKKDSLFLAYAFSMLAVVVEVQAVTLRGAEEAQESGKLNPRKETQNFAFSIAPEKWRSTSRFRTNATQKTMMFSPIIPGNYSTYIYDTEDAYYEQYSKAFFGITSKKSGWDCMRHYEIIMSGSIPYFLNLDRIPAKTMTSFPKELISRAMKLPGVPSEMEVWQAIYGGKVPEVNLDQFDKAGYTKIREELMKYAEQKLLSTSMAAKVVPSDASVYRVLIHSSHSSVGYGQYFLVNGLVNNGHSVCARPHDMLDSMRDDYTGTTVGLTGRGYSWIRTVDHRKLAQDCSKGPWDYYLLVADGNAKYPEPDPDAVKTAGKVIAINANDIGQAHLPVPAVATEYFKREGN
ncbi:MOD1 [Symbiodinium sp. CCMP2456]|nr:MOD1 [Symbiodinium sp. CCMP2456]